MLVAVKVVQAGAMVSIATVTVFELAEVAAVPEGCGLYACTEVTVHDPSIIVGRSQVPVEPVAVNVHDTDADPDFAAVTVTTAPVTSAPTFILGELSFVMESLFR